MITSRVLSGIIRQSNPSALAARTLSVTSASAKDSDSWNKDKKKEDSDTWNKAKDVAESAKETGKQKWDEFKSESKDQSWSGKLETAKEKLNEATSEISDKWNNQHEGQNRSQSWDQGYQSQQWSSPSQSQQWRNQNSYQGQGSGYGQSSGNRYEQGRTSRVSNQNELQSGKIDQWQMEAVEGDRMWLTDRNQPQTGFWGSQNLPHQAGGYAGYTSPAYQQYQDDVIRQDARDRQWRNQSQLGGQDWSNQYGSGQYGGSQGQLYGNQSSYGDFDHSNQWEGWKDKQRSQSWDSSTQRYGQSQYGQSSRQADSDYDYYPTTDYGSDWQNEEAYRKPYSSSGAWRSRRRFSSGDNSDNSRGQYSDYNESRGAGYQYGQPERTKYDNWRGDTPSYRDRDYGSSGRRSRSWLGRSSSQYDREPSKWSDSSSYGSSSLYGRGSSDQGYGTYQKKQYGDGDREGTYFGRLRSHDERDEGPFPENDPMMRGYSSRTYSSDWKQPGEDRDRYGYDYDTRDHESLTGKIMDTVDNVKDTLMHLLSRRK